jgi:glycolate oxidase
MTPTPRTSPFNKVSPADLDAFRAIVGDAYVLLDGETLASYSHDYTEDFRFPPEVVVRPGTAEEVAAVLAHCHAAYLPVTPAGARTGLSGGVLAVYGGVSLATDRLNQVLEVDTRNLQVRTQPGVITQVLQDTVAAHGLFYPVDPASRGSCFIGGNLAESSGGMRAVKYGITKDYVLDLQVALPTGELIRTGARTLKNSTGYNLTQLMVGSEGTLGVITEAVFRLEPQPKVRYLLLIPFGEAEQACDAVSAIFHAGITPSAIEFMEKDAIDFAQDYLGTQTFSTEGIEAHLLVEVDGNDEETVMKEAEAIYGVMDGFETGEVLFAQSAEEQGRIWKVRRTIGEATKSTHVVKEEDTCVPRAELAKLWRFVKETGRKYNFKTVCFGHAGDGNLHCNILRTHQSDAEWQEGLDGPIREIFTYTKSLGGTLSGEHGIGWAQKRFMDLMFSEVELRLMRGIKDLFDPKGILNPGKVFPD